jgi:hypothetical protein
MKKTYEEKTIYKDGIKLKREKEKEITEAIRPGIYIQTQYNGDMLARDWIESERKRIAAKTTRKMIVVNDQTGALILRYE